MKTSLFFLPLFALTACGTGNEKEGGALPRPDTSVGTDGGDEDGFVLDDSGTFNPDALVNDTAPEPKITVDPKTCAEAAATKAYVGCDFWPTVVANNVWSIFDYAVVVANASDEPATVEVDGNGITKKTVTVAANSLAKIYLPWNATLKGPDANNCGTAAPLPGSVFAAKGAYHLVASRPVTVYQFNALQYKGAGGEAGKDWSSCPGNTTCPTGGKVGCFSFSNDASLLLPSTAMTGNYRVTGIHGWSSKPLIGAEQDVLGAYVTITATQDNTKVVFKSRGKVLAGGGGTIAATAAGGELTMTMNAGDVAELVGEAKTTADLSGSLVAADKPVQVIVGVPCIQTPIGTQACDHLEESVFPAETLGKEYIVTPPSTPKGTSVGHNVRLYGNRDGTKLTYAPSKPGGAPDVINAGQVVTLERVNVNFKVTGDNEFAVGTFMFGGSLQDPVFFGASKGDPSMSLVTSIEQFRTKYIFLAPDDYTVSYVDIVHPADAKVTLDGAAPTGSPAAIGATGYSLTRAKLGAGMSGAHTLTADKPVGIQVMGFGDYTSYHYPGGLDLKAIAPPPPIK